MDPELLPGSGSGINHSISSTLPLGHKLSSLGLKPGHIFFTIFVLQIYFHKKRQQQRRDHRILALWTVQIRMQVNNLNLQLQFYSYLFFIIHARRTFVVDLSLLHCQFHHCNAILGWALISVSSIGLALLKLYFSISFPQTVPLEITDRWPYSTFFGNQACVACS